MITDVIESVVHDDTHFQRGSLYMRAQKCFCIKSGLNSKSLSNIFLPSCTLTVRNLIVGKYLLMIPMQLYST